MFELTPITLSGRVARLEPLATRHIPDLALAGQDETIWQYMPYGPVLGEERMTWFVEELLSRQALGADLPFAVIHLESGRAIGCTRFMEYRPAHRGVEIGGSWYAPAFQRTAVNTECKYLLLRHAFETLGLIRVQFKSDQRNERSHRAIERLGAIREGVLRKHMIMPDGYFRSSIYYSILDDEWPAVKARLEGFLGYG